MSVASDLRRVAAPFVGRAALRRWSHLILGGALLMPFLLLTSTADDLVGRKNTPLPLLLHQFGDFLLALPLVALAAFALPLVRPLEVTAARTLLGVELPDSPGPVSASGRGSRGRTAAWAVLHLGIGGLVSALTLATPPLVVLLALLPFLPGRTGNAVDRVPAALGPLAGLLLAVVLVAVVRGAGALLAKAAPALLGPSAADRLAAAERRSERLAERNRLARELHDSVGHALSVVTLQASAAGRVLDTDAEFARGALAAIEQQARGALDELDHVLGLLREEDARRGPQPDLRDLAALIESARTAGADIQLRTGPLEGVPAAVSREAYRIVQEGVTNALKHAPNAPIRIELSAEAGVLGAEPGVLVVEVATPLAEAPRGRDRGGRGLNGVRERAALLGGEAQIGLRNGEWVVAARLPWEARWSGS